MFVLYAFLSAQTPLEYLRLVEEHLKRFEEYTLTNQASYAYDAIWAVALALNRTMNILAERRLEDGTTKKLEDFTFDDKDVSRIILESINSVHFEGVSVRHEAIESQRDHI